MARRSTGSIGDTDRRMLWAALLAASAWWTLEAGIHTTFFDGGPIAQQLLTTDTHELWMRSLVSVILLAFGSYAYVVVNRVSRALEEQARLQVRLEETLTKVLSGFLPICASCKKIRMSDADPNNQASWHLMETYLMERTDLQLTHGVCPSCASELYGEAPGYSREAYED